MPNYPCHTTVFGFDEFGFDRDRDVIGYENKIRSTNISAMEKLLFFGSQRKKIYSQIVEATRPNIAVIQNLYGLPPDFWRDQYVLGYLHGQMSAFIMILGRNKLSTEDKGRILIDTFTALSNMNGGAIVAEANTLVESQDPDFIRAHENAFLVVMYAFGLVKDEASEPDIVKARELAIAMGEGTSREHIGAYLQKSLWSDEVCSRFQL